MKRGYLYIAVTTLLFSSMEVALKLISGQFNPIQLNFSRADHVGRGRKGRGVGLGDLQRHHVAELGGEGHLGERDPLFRVSVQRDELAVKIHGIFGRLEQLRASLQIWPRSRRAHFSTALPVT